MKLVKVRSFYNTSYISQVAVPIQRKDNISEADSNNILFTNYKRKPDFPFLNYLIKLNFEKHKYINLNFL